MEEFTGIIGRDDELRQCEKWIDAGYSIVVKGRPGIGKSALLRQLHRNVTQTDQALWIANAPPKQMLINIAHQLQDIGALIVPESLIPEKRKHLARQSGVVHWEWIQRALSRASIQRLTGLVMTSVGARRFIVFIESLELPPTQAAFILELNTRAQLITAVSETNRRERIKRLLWDIEKELELKPLPPSTITEICNLWLDQRRAEFASTRCRRSFLRYVQQESGGIPLAIRGLLEHAAKSPVIDCKDLRAFRHDAGVRYLDMTPVVVLVIIGFMAMRYISRGMGEMEMLVMSGVASALFYGLSIVLRSMRR